MTAWATLESRRRHAKRHYESAVSNLFVIPGIVTVAWSIAILAASVSKNGRTYVHELVMIDLATTLGAALAVAPFVIYRRIRLTIANHDLTQWKKERDR